MLVSNGHASKLGDFWPWLAGFSLRENVNLPKLTWKLRKLAENRL
jgi:hypothetical protein